MYIEGPLRSGKTSRLISKFIELINSGVSTSEILVICANSFKKRAFIEKIKGSLLNSSLKGFGDFPIYTFNGIVYNTIRNYWPIIEEKIASKNNNHTILPNLCGLEATEYILKLCINEINQKHNFTDTFLDYYSNPNLIHQLLRRYRLITENCLTEAEVEEKSAFLDETFREPADNALKELKDKTLILRSFDYLKQTNTFLYLIKSIPQVSKNFEHIKYLLADDVDELSYAAQSFIKAMLPNIKEFYLTADPEGGTRRGYLCAYPDGWNEIKQVKNAEIVKLETQKPLYSDATKLFKAIKSNQSGNFEHIKTVHEIKRAQMLESALDKIKELIKKDKVKPENIIIVTPAIDESIKCTLIEFFDQEYIQYQFLSGTKKLVDNPIVFGCLIISQLINDNWKLKPTPFEIRILLTNLLGIPIHYCKDILDSYKKHKKLKEDIDLEQEEFNQKYQALIQVINGLKDKKLDLYEQIVEIFTQLIASEIEENSELDDLNETLKSLDGFFKVIEKLDEDEKPECPEKEWLIQIKNTVVSDNPPSAPDIRTDSIIIATPQRIVDLELESKHQIWLDISSTVWTKDDTGPLYNSWVFQKNWNKQEYTPEIHKELTLNKTAHLLRKLVLCANEEITAYSSQLDSSGNENIGILPQFLDQNSCKLNTDFKVIIPREDQKPVLEYSGGKMAIPAVPGAGKTTIMQALIIELIKKGIKPGEILVLTYMESAARVFQNRIKRSCPGLNELPYINTIHGLALKIIQDEDNFVKLGLNSDFQICDDTDRTRILYEICSQHLPPGEEDINKWMELNAKAISKGKLVDLSWQEIAKHIKTSNNQQLREFLPVYKAYIQTLKGKGLIDFDDLLVMATKLLRNYPEIRNYYQKQYRFIIEDEAQDSSKIQQEFISIISDYHGNLIRCGDANQAITTTFSNADVQGFRDFIENNNCVSMLSSQRCSKEIYELANHFIDWSKTQEDLNNAFLDLKMEPVEGKNPEIKDGLNFKILETVDSEKSWILSEIKRLQSQDPDLTCGILLRANWQVFEWASYLEKNDIKYVCFTDTLKQKKVFRFLLKFLESLENPWDNKLISELYEEFINAKIIKKDFDSVNFLKNKIGSPFISYDSTELVTENLVNFWWDLHYWLENSYLPTEELILKLGSYYFDNIIDKSNVHLLSVLVKKFKNNFTDHSDNSKIINLPDIVKHFKDLSKKSKIGGVRFFSEPEEDKDNPLAGYVQIMTVHKAKGNEFDAVFMPEMYETSYSISQEFTKVRTEDVLLQQISNISESESIKSELQIKIAQMEETLRLIYVGITRAKKYLYISSACKRLTKYNKSYDVLPSKVLEYFVSLQETKSKDRLYIPNNKTIVSPNIPEISEDVLC
ncbi:MAG: hypothetical protein A2287_05160 [Candidatus Melainabacteria bacterium RIFOXYA12_FULL_32_12]|nr:MAG: hypothetical protein A2287_05160 [Candidatus Melainabacteria bacterium RIFOXYA12_FULL_32_12]